ncbi:hypothetical protein HAX54_015245 [Datura stramonium]|uniref:Dof-type domain-containing protein n=1 Tax=Datura stramonium TaxID=4076 RepID=A0ABS8TSR9_DATST|nr:hypothetical protein [Datura stramonium]
MESEISPKKYFHKLQGALLRSCKRHWTQGGFLRNVPIGGRGRKNKQTQPLKITSSTCKDDNEARWHKFDLNRQKFQPALFCSGPTTSVIVAREKNSQIVVQSKQNYYQDFLLVTSNIDEEKNIFDNFTSSSIPYDTIDNMIKGSIDTIPCSISTSTQSSDIYNYLGNLDSTMEEESTITWQGPRTTSVMDNLSNNWNWDDIEALVSAWDDEEIKP